ncbi:hypothetical protein PFBG_00445 [Plasmodium falciparum 7G8]|uniref:Uncharacterized protein n=1 Tax=Plasmodium falciparum (isolate 7G8) TaxID=57266 RepID=W7FUC3_PLAF8|nr:hypothetical protein PFBG_00445 [Plasmodium falciparum 7G8]
MFKIYIFSWGKKLLLRHKHFCKDKNNINIRIYGNIPHWTYKQNTIQITYFLTLQFEIMKTFKKNIKIKDMNIYTIHR